MIGGGVFAVTEVQRRGDAASFEQYAAGRELRTAALNMALAFGEASEHGAEASETVDAAQRALVLTTARV